MISFRSVQYCTFVKKKKSYNLLRDQKFLGENKFYNVIIKLKKHFI